jgi:hypothetical protein
MSISDRHADAAQAAIKRAVAAFIRSIDRIEERHDAMSFQLIEEWVLLELCEVLTKRIDGNKTQMPEALLKLSNAMADYRDSRWADR